MSADFQVGPWLVKPSLNTISCNGTTARLEPKVMQVLVCLAGHPDEALGKEELVRAVWPDTFVSDDALKHCISELRRVFEDDAREPRIIQTIPKHGYRLLAPVQPVNGSKGVSTPAMQAPASDPAKETGVRRWWTGAVAVGAVILLSLLLIAVKGSPLRKWLIGQDGIPSIHSLAVLPLQNLSSDPTQEYFSDGMTDALITDLAQIGTLKVISRTSSMQYKQTKKSLPEIARELNVDAIVEGTVQRSDDRVRITAQLIYGASDKHLWAKSYERDLRDVLALERDLTEEIAGQIQAQLTTTAQWQLAEPRPVNTKALDAYLEGNYHLNRFGVGSGDEEKRKAAEHFQQAIDADPNFAAAYVGMAQAHSNLVYPTSQDLAITRKAVETALSLDPNSPEARAELGDVKSGDWDWQGAEEEYRRAVALSPNDVSGHNGLCYFLTQLGRLDEGLKECEMAQQLDPNEDHLSSALYWRREYDRAIEVVLRMLRSHRDRSDLHYTLYASYTGKGMYKEAVHELEQAAALLGAPEIAAQIHRAFSVSGYRGAMREWAKALEHLAVTNQAFPPIELAETYAALGEKDLAFYWLKQAYKNRGIGTAYLDLTCIKVDPMLDPLRSDSRFKDLVRRVGLPP